MSQATMAFDDGQSVIVYSVTSNNRESENIYIGKTNDITRSQFVMLSEVGALFQLNAHSIVPTQDNWDINIDTKLPPITWSLNQRRVITAKGFISLHFALSISRLCLCAIRAQVV